MIGETDMKTKQQEIFCRTALFFLLSLSLLVSFLQCFQSLPPYLIGSVSLLWEVRLIPLTGMLYPLTQIGSAISGMLAWIMVRIFGAPYQIGILLPPLLSYFGAALVARRVEAGRAMFLGVLIPSTILAGIPALFSLITLPSANDFQIQLQQTLYYLMMLAIPVGEMILLHGWLVSRPNK